MLVLLASWVYCLILSGIYGFSLLNWAKKNLRLDGPSYASFIFCFLSGLAFITALSGLFSLFLPVGLAVQCILLTGAIILAILQFPQIWPALRSALKETRKSNRWVALTFLAFLAVVWLRAAQPPLNYDSGLYHAQAIRWIETYPAVPGLGNLQDRLAFNSNWLLSMALFSFSFLGLSSLHASGALLILVTSAYAFRKIERLFQGQLSLSNVAALGIIFFLRRFFSLELSSPGTDLPAALLVWLVFLFSFEKIEAKAEQQADISGLVITLLSIYALTVKLSVLPLLLLPVYFFFRRRRPALRTALLGYGLLAALILLPWMARNVILSGYLVYPVAQVDLFQVDWKIPADQVRETAQTIQTWARTGTRNGLTASPASLDSWVPLWFSRLEGLDKQILAAGGLGLVFLGILAACAWRFKRGEITSALQPAWILYAAAGIGLIFWFWNAPDFRFGYAFWGIWLCLLFSPWLYGAIIAAQWLRPYLLYLALFALLGYQLIGLAGSGLSSLPERWLWPAGYPAVQTRQQTLGEFKVYIPANGDQCWYAPLPCTPKLMPAVAPRGQSPQDGFRYTQSK